MVARRRKIARLGVNAALLLVAIVLQSPGVAAQSAAFREGLSAFNRGEYQTAFNDWAPSAGAGDPEAQSGMGFLYYKGLGVELNYATAFAWYRRAAAQGQPEAQMFLGALYLYGEGVARDLVQAYAWCEISQSSGANGGLGCRDEAARRMTPAEIASAIRVTAEWYRRGPAAETR